MAVPVAGASKAPAEAAEQEDHEYDYEDEPERHEPLPFAGAKLSNSDAIVCTLAIDYRANYQYFQSIHVIFCDGNF